MFANSELTKHEVIGNNTKAFASVYNHEDSNRRH